MIQLTGDRADGRRRSADAHHELDELYTSVSRAQRYSIGFPGARDLSVPVLERWLTLHLNNIGDPYDEGLVPLNSKRLERQVVSTIAQLMRAPDTRWGYVTSGSTEGNEHALYEARRRYPDVVAYTSAAAHYSVRKSTDKLAVPLVTVPASADGRLDLGCLTAHLDRRRDRAAIVVATAGTTMTEAMDDVPGIVAALDQAGISRRRVHVDAALSGVPLALLPAVERPPFDFAVPGVTSIVVSGHKFLSTLMPCGVLVYAERPYPTSTGTIPYTGSGDTTISGSRSGHLPLILWYILHAFDHARRAEDARELAQYACHGLRLLGVRARRHRYAMTVYFPALPDRVMRRYGLARDGGQAHLITMPGVSRAVIDEFLDDTRAALTAAEPVTAGRRSA
jgi:histidine decarboxylase